MRRCAADLPCLAVRTDVITAPPAQSARTAQGSQTSSKASRAAALPSPPAPTPRPWRLFFLHPAAHAGAVGSDPLHPRRYTDHRKARGEVQAPPCEPPAQPTKPSESPLQETCLCLVALRIFCPRCVRRSHVGSRSLNLSLSDTLVGRNRRGGELRLRRGDLRQLGSSIPGEKVPQDPVPRDESVSS